jgi:hypothetical protein
MIVKAANYNKLKHLLVDKCRVDIEKYQNLLFYVMWKLIYIVENDLEAWNQLQGNNKAPKLTIYIKSFLSVNINNMFKRFKLIY